MTDETTTLSIIDVDNLKKAVALLEAPSITLKITEALGSPIEAALKKLPDSTQDAIQHATQRALTKAVDAAFYTISTKPESIVSENDGSIGSRAKGLFNRFKSSSDGQNSSSDLSHKIAVGVSGAIGGMFGIASMTAELPATTILILRSIADIARSEGADLNDENIKKECLEVFALGAPTEDDDAADSAYYASRAAMSLMVRETGVALTEIATKQAGAAASTNILTKVIEAVAKRFGIAITEKMAAQAVPILGAVTGAAINTMFMSHFQDVARGHFIIYRLEKTYGKEFINIAYNKILAEKKLEKQKQSLRLAE